MERFIFAVFVLTLNGAYWMDYLKTFDKTSDDGAIGKAMIGFLILICSGVLLFNLDIII